MRISLPLHFKYKYALALFAAPLLASPHMAVKPSPKAKEHVHVAADKGAMHKIKPTRIRWANPEIQVAVDMGNPATACTPASIVKLRFDKRDIPYDQADRYYYQPASQHKLLLVAFVHWAATDLKDPRTGKPLISLDDKVTFTKDALTIPPSIDNLFKTTEIKDRKGRVKTIDERIAKYSNETRSLRWLLSYSLEHSANDGVDAIGRYIGQRIIEAKLSRFNGPRRPYAEQRMAVHYMNYFAKEVLGVSKNFSAVNFSGESVINYNGAENGHRLVQPLAGVKGAKRRGLLINYKRGANQYSLLDGCRVARYIQRQGVKWATFVPNGNEGRFMPGFAGKGETVRVKSGTMMDDSGIRVLGGWWQSRDKLIYGMVNAPCIFKLEDGRERCVDPSRSRNAMLRKLFASAAAKISTDLAQESTRPAAPQLAVTSQKWAGLKIKAL